ncbi:MAG: GTP cyclohydrolase, FolE2/MptA family [Geobacteraceae bacterium]|nr:GTP cyclohydrolase, FolE2/MptA family [Geobacteraceae bacterium]
MKDEKRFMQDVGMSELPFPMKVLSRENPEGQHTIARISIAARIMHEFEARWIDKFIQILHQHRDHIGTESLKGNIIEYMKELNATKVKVDFNYPFFIEKKTPVTMDPCLVRYQCTYSASVSKSDLKPKVSLKITVPCVTSYPSSDIDKPGGLFGQLSSVDLEVQSQKDIFPEELIEIVDKHCLVPVYSYLTEEDQAFVIGKVHSEKKSSVVMVDEIKEELANMREIDGYSLTCSNFGMLHSYSTFIGTAKSMWIPLS